MKIACLALALCISLAAHGQQLSIGNATVKVKMDPAGNYSITYSPTHWEIKGHLPSRAESLHAIHGSDAAGSYHEVTATFADGSRAASIRVYDKGAVLFTDKRTQQGANAQPFPSFDALPPGLMHFTYQDKTFGPYAFGQLASEGPWVLFDKSRNTMVLSPADHFLVSSMTQQPDGTASSGIDGQITTLPAGFSHRTLLDFGSGINRTMDRWGSALLALHGKRPIANDASVVLNKFGYWTDNGAHYYYKFDPRLGYEGTLLALRDEYRKLGVPFAYLQLDSWWYVKDKGNKKDDGTMVYRADPKVFPDGLDAFQQKLDLPMVTHARWISENSPYRKQYKMSRNVILSPTFWEGTADYLKKANVVVYEQDWLNDKARPAINIDESHAFLKNMADAMAHDGIGIQYCMPLPAYYMATTEFPNLRTIRTSGDRFERHHYDVFLYGSELAHAVGILPWSDVFMSNELGNLVISTLSDGPVGVGDALGAEDVENLKRVMRTDSVILKPDAPLVPIDATYIADAQNKEQPMVAMTRTDFGAASEYYLFAYPRNASDTQVNVPLRDLGISGPAYAYDWVGHKGVLVPADGGVAMNFTNGWAYTVVVPVGKSGIALLGDASKIVPLARKRFTGVSEHSASVVFAPGEKTVAISGYAAHKPRVHAASGRVSGMTYDKQTHLFSFALAPAPGADRASVHLR